MQYITSSLTIETIKYYWFKVSEKYCGKSISPYFETSSKTSSNSTQDCFGGLKVMLQVCGSVEIDCVSPILLQNLKILVIPS